MTDTIRWAMRRARVHVELLESEPRIEAAIRLREWQDKCAVRRCLVACACMVLAACGLMVLP